MYQKGNFEEITQRIRKNKSITAVFISLDMLSGLQLANLQKAFKVPVYDRYITLLPTAREGNLFGTACLFTVGEGEGGGMMSLPVWYHVHSRAVQCHLLRVATAQGKQGIWFLLFPDRENTGKIF